MIVFDVGRFNFLRLLELFNLLWNYLSFRKFFVKSEGSLMDGVDSVGVCVNLRVLFVGLWSGREGSVLFLLVSFWLCNGWWELW